MIKVPLYQLLFVQLIYYCVSNYNIALYADRLFRTLKLMSVRDCESVSTWHFRSLH